jgi:hemerythrin-like domain-containing protein
VGVSQEQQDILRLRKELKQVELDRIAEATRYIKKGGQHLLQERRDIFQFMKVLTNKYLNGVPADLRAANHRGNSAQLANKSQRLN